MKPKHNYRIKHSLTCSMLLAAAACLTITSCIYETEPEPAPSGHLLFVYLGGDNNLSTESYEKLEALRLGWQTTAADTHLLVYHDAAGAHAHLVEIRSGEGGTARIDHLQLYGDENSATGAALSRAVKDARSRYPSATCGLLVFSHGTGWLPASGGSGASTTETRTIVVDGNHEMPLTEFAEALPAGVFDYIVFEACFMAGIEVAYELRSKTPYLLASSAEIVSPGFTDIYPHSLHYLTEGRLEEFGNVCFKHFAGQEDAMMRSFTMSLIKTSGLEALQRLISRNTEPVVHAADDPLIASVQPFDRYVTHLFYDFEDYYSRMLPDDEKRGELSALIDDCIVWKASTESFLTNLNGFDIRRHSGMTTYIRQDIYPALNSAYGELSWNND